MHVARVLLLGLAAIALSAGVAGATHSEGRGPAHDFAAGTLHTSLETGLGTTRFDVHINARSRPPGQDADGTVWVRATAATGGGEIRAEVTCLVVLGDLAVAGGPVTRIEGEAFSQDVQMLWVSVQDLGETGSDPVTPDRLDFLLSFVSLPPQVCQGGFPFFPATEGNVVVHNALP